MGEFVGENPLVLVIGAAEIAFWVVLAAGLVARYVLRLRTVGTVLLVGVPVVDLVLVGACVADVASGSPPGTVHGMAALYLGFTVAFGHSLVRWADVRFAHRFAGGPAPVRPPRGGPARTRHEWRQFAMMLVAWVVTVGVTALLAAVAGTAIPAPLDWTSDPLWSWPSRATIAAAIWLVTGPLWATPAHGTGDRERADAR